MPSPPEISDAGSGIGIIKVLTEMEAGHKSHTDGHIRISTEIKIYLEHKEEHSQPEWKSWTLFYAVQRNKKVKNLGTGIGKESLLSQTYGKPCYSPGELVSINGTIFYLLRNVLITNDGAGDTLMEETRIQKNRKEVTLCGYLASVYVNGVGNELEGIEGYTYRQHYVYNLRGESRNTLQNRWSKSQVLKYTEDQETPYKVDHKPALTNSPSPVRIYAYGAYPVNKYHYYKYYYIFRISPGIKDKGKD